MKKILRIAKALDDLQVGYHLWLEGKRFSLDVGEIFIVRDTVWFSCGEITAPMDDGDNLQSWVEAYVMGEEAFREHLIETGLLELTA